MIDFSDSLNFGKDRLTEFCLHKPLLLGLHVGCRVARNGFGSKWECHCKLKRTGSQTRRRPVFGWLNSLCFLYLESPRPSNNGVAISSLDVLFGSETRNGDSRSQSQPAAGDAETRVAETVPRREAASAIAAGLP